MWKKIFALLVSVMIFFSFVACSQTEETNGGQSETTKATTTDDKNETTTAKKSETTKKETEVENPFAEKMTINWLVGPDAQLYEEGRWDELELEEKFNVDLKLWNIRIDSKNMEQIQMMLAAGDVPDYGFYYTSGKELNEQGLGRTIPLDMIKQYYPTYYKYLMEDPIGLSFNKVEDKEDEYYGLTSFTVMSTHTGHVPMWRLDWLQDLGFQLDNLEPMDHVINDEYDDNIYFSTTKFTMEEVKEIYRSFTEDDPDGNGVDDTYATPFNNVWYDMYTFYACYGLDRNGNHFYEDPVTGDYVPYYAYTPYKDALAFVTEMLDKGYMRWLPGEDSYFNEYLATWSSGKVGFFNANSAGRLSGKVEQSPPTSVLLNEPDATFVITPVPGEGKYRPYWTFDWNAGYTYPIGMNVSDAKLARLFQILEYSYFGENWLRYKWGIEGVHYKWTGEPFNSPIKKADPEKVPAKYAGTGTDAFGQFGNRNFIKDVKVYFSYDAFTFQFVDFWNKYNENGYKGDNLWIRPDKYFSEFTMPEEKYKEFEKLKEETIDQIGTVYNDFQEKVFDGEIANLDSEWELYIEQLYSAGLEQWVEIWNSEDVKTYEYYTNLK